MRLISPRTFLIAAFLTNIFLAMLMWSYLDTNCECSEFQTKYTSHRVHEKHDREMQSNNTHLEDEILIVIREFEYFENDVAETVRSILKHLPHVKVLIVSDKTPYPPLQIPNTQNVHVLNLKATVNKPAVSQWPLNFIEKEHIFIFPDSTRILNVSQLTAMMDRHRTIPTMIIAAPLVNEMWQCLALNVSLRHWTMKYRKSKNKVQCSALTGRHVLLVTKELLFKLSHPFVRPFPASLFIQTSLHKIKVDVLPEIQFGKSKQLFTNPHNKWKHDSFEHERKWLMYDEFGIKKILFPESKVEWYGCSKTSTRCFGTVVDDMPEYLFEGRWTPPCCLENLRQTARYVFGILEKCNVRYWLEGGSLLGAARNGDVIPWDYDVDIGMYNEDINKCEWLKNAQNQSIIDTQGFVWEKATEGDFIRVQFSQTNHLHVDIFPFYPRNGIMTKNTWFVTHKQDMEFPEHFLIPLEKIKFVGVRASAPNHVREFLEMKFGRGAIENPEYPDSKVLKFRTRNRV